MALFGRGGRRGWAAFGAQAGADGAEPVRFDPEIEPLVRLIEETPRDKCVEALLAQVRGGLSYRRFLAAVFMAAVRRQNSHHQMYKVHSVHQVCLDLPRREQMLPLFWAVDAFKSVQERTGPVPPPLPVLQGPLPPAGKAEAGFRDAMERSDAEAAERAAAALVRSRGMRRTMEQLWPYACRDGGNGGHHAISAANACRAVEAVGGQHAEPVLRFVVREWAGSKSDGFFAANTVRVDKHLERMPAGWSGGKEDSAVTLEMFAAMREGKDVQAACDLAVLLLSKGVESQAIWDAVHLATAELMVRHGSGWGLASRPLHSNTSTNARHFAFDAASSARTRLLVLLQAVAWAAENTRALVGPALRDIPITRLAGAALPADTRDAVAEVFALLPERTYYWDDKAKKAVLTYGKREDADEACRKVFALVKERPQAAPLLARESLSWLCRKAGGDSHSYKIAAAMLENAAWVSPAWRPHVLAASVHYLHGNRSLDHAAVQQAREGLRQEG